MRISTARNSQPLMLLLPILLLTVLTHPAVGFRGLDVVDATLRHRPHYPLLQFTAATSFRNQPSPSIQLFHSSPKQTSGEDRGGNNNNNNNNNRKKKTKGTKFNSKFQQRPKRQQRRPGERDRNKNQNPAIQRNRNIISLGKTFNWEAILDLYQKESTDFSFINYATTMIQLGRIISFDTKNPIFFQFMEDLATNIENRGLDWIGIQGIANIVYSIGKMGLRNKSAERIIEFTTESRNANIIGSQGKLQNIANICWGIAKLKDVENFSSFLPHVEPHFERLFGDMKPQEASNLAYSCAESGVKSPMLFELIEKHSTWLVENGTPQAVANTAWSCASLGYQSPNLFAAIEKHSTWLVENGTPQGVANTAWACASLGIRSPKLFEAIEMRATWLVDNGTPQGVANTAWACASLGIRSPKLFEAIEMRATWLVDNGNSQDIANTAWACASFGIRSPKLFEAIEMRATWLVDNGTPQGVANTAWACASLGIRSPKLFEAIEMRATWLVDNGNSQDIANTAWACATLGVRSLKLFEAIEMRATWLVDNGTPQGVANTAWACATLGVRSLKLFEAIEKHSTWLVENGTPQAAANTAWAFAIQAIPSPKFFQSIMDNLETILKPSNSQAIINFCYSIAVLDLMEEYEDGFRMLWSMALSLDPCKIPIKGWTQLVQTYLFVTDAGLEIQKLTIPPGIIAGKHKISSPSQKEISELLTEIGFEHEQRFSPITDNNEEVSSFLTAGFQSIDFASLERKIAIEFNGPSHYLYDLQTGERSSVEDGRIKAKRRFLERIGWKVYDIRYSDWNNAKAKGKEAKRDLLIEIVGFEGE